MHVLLVYCHLYSDSFCATPLSPGCVRRVTGSSYRTSTPMAFRLRVGGGLEPLLTHIRRLGVVTTYGSPRWLLWLIGWPDRLDRTDEHGHMHGAATRAFRG